MAVLEDLRSGGSIQGILPRGAVTVVSVQWFGSDAIELTYRDSAGCERKKRAAEALAYNGLVRSWPEIVRLAREKGVQPPAEAVLL